jgi:hypothetical protein
LSEIPTTTQSDVASNTIFKSADTVKRFSMNAPNASCIVAKTGKYLRSDAAL